MKLFSNFDTGLGEKIYHENILKYNKENVMIVYRYKIFFVLFVLIPFVIYLLIIGIIFGFIYNYSFGDELLDNIRWSVFGIGVTGSLIYHGWYWLKKVIDYHLDFIIINPYEIIMYNQTHLFSRDIKTIDVSKLKTVSVFKRGIINSLFNYGSLIFFTDFSEGGENGVGEITMTYIYDPDSFKDKISKIIFKNRKQNITNENLNSKSNTNDQRK